MSSELLCLGISHRRSPLEVRERLSVRPDDLPDVLRGISALPEISESLVLSTCNRVEIYAHGRVPHAFDALIHFLNQRHSLPASFLSQHIYRFSGKGAVQQIFRVATSVDSLVVGEPQILGQVKEALALAQEVKAAGPKLTQTFAHAFLVAKRVRTQTDIARSALSVSHVAVELAQNIFSDLKGRPCVLVGAGQMAELAAKCLKSKGAELHIANRSLANAQSLGETLGAHAHRLADLPDLLLRADIVLSSAACDKHLLSYDAVRTVMPKRRFRPIFFLDIAVPRSLDPQIARIDGAYVYNMDDLGQIVQERQEARMSQAELASQIIDEEIEAFMAQTRARAHAPLIAAITAQAKHIAQTEAQKTIKALGDDVTPEQRLKIEYMAQAVANKLLHVPLTEIRSLAALESNSALEHHALVSRIFGIHEH